MTTGFEVFNAQTDWEIVRNNWELGREIDERRHAIARNSGWRFTDEEWDQVLPTLITSIVDHLPAGDHLQINRLSDIRVSRGPVKRKEIHIQRSPDGSSTATITETGQ